MKGQKDNDREAHSFCYTAKVHYMYMYMWVTLSAKRTIVQSLKHKNIGINVKAWYV